MLSPNTQSSGNIRGLTFIPCLRVRRCRVALRQEWRISATHRRTYAPVAGGSNRSHSTRSRTHPTRGILVAGLTIWNVHGRSFHSRGSTLKARTSWGSRMRLASLGGLPHPIKLPHNTAPCRHHESLGFDVALSETQPVWRRGEESAPPPALGGIFDAVCRS